MRIVAGVARGRRLAAPGGRKVRPTADRVREAVFSSLQPRLAGARVLDLFAGSGALGLEALSRGAVSATFVERDRAVAAVLRDNADVVGVGRVHVVVAAAAGAVRGELPGSPFDLVFVDPPYDTPDRDLGGVLSGLSGHLTDGALVVVERDVRAGSPAWPDALIPLEPRRYGGTVLHRAELRGPDGHEPHDRRDECHEEAQ